MNYRRWAMAMFLLTMPAAFAQQPWTWPEKPKNLQVLPKDFTGQKLRPVMIGFTGALGVRCTYCHVGEEGKPLSTYDFASDENPNKNRARDMYRILGSINDQLKKMQLRGETRVNMWCHTCHQGRARPMKLGEELGEAYEKSGITGALTRYRELRDNDAAIAIFRLNATQYPQSGNAWDSLAEAYLSAGKKALAEIYYRKSAELDPQNENALKKLRELEGKPPE